MPSQRAWDFLSIALSVMTADAAGSRDASPDGWTREFDVHVAVAEPDFWNTQGPHLAKALAFLTTDRWSFHFLPGGASSLAPAKPVYPTETSVALLSGGLDSLIGAIDLSHAGESPLAVSQIVRGDAEKQDEFARRVLKGLRHLQINHNAKVPSGEETSQRARSVIFIAFGVLAATCLSLYRNGGEVPLYVCENGFIAINPPLTGSRIGSLSTRTAHPVFLSGVQSILDAAGIRVRIRNPYATATKGEMLTQCSDQTLLKSLAFASTSCGRFQRWGYRHCGRCVPCQVRRAAFIAWGENDPTEYVFRDLGRDDSDHAGFDDVRSVGIALASIEHDGFDDWLGGTLGWPKIQNRAALKEMLRRGLAELGSLHARYGVK